MYKMGLADIDICSCNRVKNALLTIASHLYFIYYLIILLSICEFYLNELFSFSIIVMAKKYFLAIASFCTSWPSVAPSVSPLTVQLCGKDAAALFYCFPLKN